MLVEAFVQARMKSTRLPGKVLKKVLGKPLLEFLVERLKDCNEIDDIVILTSDQPEDDVIATYCHQKKLHCFRGSEEDVLDRYYQASLMRKPDGIVRITADCPLIDPEIVDQTVTIFRKNFPLIDYVSNTMLRTFPRGLDVEVFSSKALKKAFESALSQEEREHVTLFMYRHPSLFRLENVEMKPSLGNYRWTVDTAEDFTLICLILEHLYDEMPKFRFMDIVNLLSIHPEWNQINAHIEQKKIS